MKKFILSLVFAVYATGNIWSQCVPSCSNYIVSPITFTTFTGLGGASGYGGNEQFLSDDQCTGALNIGFTFTFMCNAYSQFVISSNGFISFDLAAPNGCCSGQTLPNAATPNDLIAIFWNDLYPPGGGTITYATTGVSPNQKCIITYTNVPFCCTASPPFSSGQIVLYETTNIIELYVSNQQGNGAGAMTQGIENSTGSLAFTTPGRNGTAWTCTNSGYRYVPAGAPSAPAAIIGNTVACAGTTQVFSIPPSPGASGYIWSLPAGWTGTSTTSAITTTIGASGTISVSATYTCGNSVPTMLTFSAISAPLVSITSASPNLVCSGSPAIINGSGAATFTLEPGGNTNGPPFTVNPIVNTVYTLSGTDATGCNSVNNPTVMIYVNETPTVTVNSGAICLGESFNITPSGASNYTVTGGFFQVTPTAAGISNYSVAGTGTNGCTSNVAVSSVTVNPVPNVIAAATRTDICKGESTSITASGASSYSWSTGATTPTISVNPGATSAYTVTGAGTGNCLKSVVVNVKVSLCVGINENGEGNKEFVMVYPNPSNGEFSLKTKAATTITIYDVQGKLIYNQKVNEGTHLINLSQYASGEYLLKAFQGDNQQNITLIKQ